MKTDWKAEKNITGARFIHSSGLLKIKKYRRGNEVFARRVKQLFACYYRHSKKHMFGWHVDKSCPFYLTILDAMQAGELWIKENKGIKL
jgi:hypothetical protein